MVSGGLQWVKVVAVLSALTASGCFWRDFDERVATHTALLEAMAHKGVDLVVADRFTAEGLGEMLYPLARGRALAETARRRLGTRTAPASLTPFEALLDAYAALCDLVDRQRRAAPGTAAAAVLGPALAEVERRAAAVRRAQGASGRAAH